METRLTINKLKEALWPLAAVVCTGCGRGGLRSKLTQVPHHTVDGESRTVHEEWYCTTCLDQLVQEWGQMVQQEPRIDWAQVHDADARI